MRTFIAFKLPEEVIASLGDLQKALKQQGLKLRWVHPDNIHLTLKFLGDISAEEIPAVKRVIRTVSRSQTVFSLEAKGLGVFPTVKKAQVLWSGIHGDVKRLGDFQSNLDRALAGMGFEPEKRAFRGHLTLGRIKRRVDGRVLASAISRFGSFVSPPLTAERLILFKSDLKPSGAVYQELFAENLSNADDAIQARTDGDII